MRFPVIDCLFDATSGRNAAEAEFSKSLRCFPAAGELLPAMDRAGVRQALVTQCKRWSCERQWLCVDMRVQDVLSLVRPAPDRLAGLAGYNPHAITESLHEIDEAAASGGFRGIYLNAENFGVTLVDNRVYPLYAKAASLRWPVMVQFGINWKSVAYASTFADLLHVAGDFPELTLVAALRWWPSLRMLEQFTALAENLYFAVPAALLDETRLAAEILDSPVAERLMWGSQGRNWAEAVLQLEQLPGSEAALRGLAGATAERVFGLGARATVNAPFAGDVMAAET